MKFFSKERYTPNERLLKLNLLEDAVDAIFSVENKSLGNNLFESVVNSIHLLTGADTVIIGQYNEMSESVTTIAYFDNGQIRENFTYLIQDTPCKHVILENGCQMASGASLKFPNDNGLIDRKIEAYVGIPVFYKGMVPKGLILAMFKTPVDNCKIVESLLKILGMRVALELEHVTNRRLLEEKNENLNALFAQLKKKNLEMDQYIAEVEHAKAMADESNQLKTAFLANLSHEVRTPMNVMLGFAELLKSDVLSHEERGEYIDIINQNGMQLLKIMDNLIDISKFQSRKCLEQPKPLRLNDILDRFFVQYNDYIHMIQKSLVLKITKALPDGGDVVVADYEGVTKVLNQLLDNAVKFTTQGAVEFGYRIDNRNICFFVSDTGIGVPDGMEDKIFEMFRQVDLRQSRQFGGNGLGLAIARKFTELMGGEIWLDRSVKNGACFCFTIPFVQSDSVNVSVDSSVN